MPKPLTPDDVIKRSENGIRNADRRGVWVCPHCDEPVDDHFEHSMSDGQEDDDIFVEPLDWDKIIVFSAVAICMLAVVITTIVLFVKHG